MTSAKSVCVVVLIAAIIRASFTCSKGNVCDVPSSDANSINWYFDTELFTCLAFCDADYNPNEIAIGRYSRKDCNKLCRPMDGATCSPPSAESPQQCEITDCPDGFECRRGMYSACCNTTASATFNQELYNPSCGNPDGGYIRAGGVDEEVRPLIGASCEDNFCPEDSTCTTGEFVSWCCA